MDARDETALIGAYERAVATCRIEQSTMPVLQEEGSLPTKDDADLQQRALSEDHCPQPRDGSSPDLEQHEQQVLQSDGTHSSQSEGNASGATGKLQLTDVSKRIVGTNLPFTVTCASPLFCLQMMATLCQ